MRQRELEGLRLSWQQRALSDGCVTSIICKASLPLPSAPLACKHPACQNSFDKDSLSHWVSPQLPFRMAGLQSLHSPPRGPRSQRGRLGSSGHPASKDQPENQQTVLMRWCGPILLEIWPCAKIQIKRVHGLGQRWKMRKLPLGWAEENVHGPSVSTTFRNPLSWALFHHTVLSPQASGGPSAREQHGTTPTFTTIPQRAPQEYQTGHESSGQGQQRSPHYLPSAWQWQVRTRESKPGSSRPGWSDSLSGTQSPNLQNTAYLTSCKPRQHWRMSFVNGESCWHIHRAPRRLTQTFPRSKTLSDIMTS